MPTVAQTITYLEMTAPDELVEAEQPPAGVVLEPLDLGSADLARSTCARIGGPHHWSISGWSRRRWRERLSAPQVRTWIARSDGEVAGMIELESKPEREVEITVFGLVPEFVGRGLGGHLLTLATRLAWEARAAGQPPPRRVWLHTSSLDHPHALRNYERRGFRVVRTVDRPRRVPS